MITFTVPRLRLTLRSELSDAIESGMFAVVALATYALLRVLFLFGEGRGGYCDVSHVLMFVFFLELTVL